MSGVAGAVGRLLRARGFLGVAGAVLVTLGGGLVVGSTALGWGQITDPGLQFSPGGVVSGLSLLEGKVAFCLGLGFVPVGTGLLFAEDVSIRRLLAVVAVVAGLMLTALCAYTLVTVGDRTAIFFCDAFGPGPDAPPDPIFDRLCTTISDAVDARVGLYLAIEASIASVVGGAFALRARGGQDEADT